MRKAYIYKVTSTSVLIDKILRSAKFGLAALLIATQLSACAMLQQEAKDYNIYVGSVQVNKLYADSEQIKTDAQPETIQKDTETQTETETKTIQTNTQSKKEQPEKSWWRRHRALTIVVGAILVAVTAAIIGVRHNEGPDDHD